MTSKTKVGCAPHTLLQMWQHGPLGVVVTVACLRVRRSSAAWLDSVMNTSRPALQVSRHVDLSAARDSSWSVGMWHFFSIAFMWSEKRFFWPPCDREPWISSPYSTRRGRRLDGILMMWPSHRSCLCMTMYSSNTVGICWKQRSQTCSQLVSLVHTTVRIVWTGLPHKWLLLSCFLLIIFTLMVNQE